MCRADIAPAARPLLGQILADGPDFIGPVELMGTCDWGACNREAVTVRWSRDHGYLSVCGPCSRSTWDRTARGRRR